LTFDSTASLPALTVNSDVTGSPSIRFDQNAVNKAIIRWQHTGTYLNINSDNDIQLRAGNTTALTLDSATQDGTFSAGLTVTDKLQTAASGLAEAGLNIPEGVAPSGPLDGDVWVTAAGEFFARLNGVSVDLAAGGGVSVSGTPVNNELAVWTDASTIEGEPSLTFNNANDRLTVGAGAAGAASPQIDINAQLTGVPTISWNQAGVAKAFISYVDADDMFAIGADNEIELRPSNVGDWGILSTTSAKFGNYTFNTDQTVGAGQDNFVLTYDNGTGEISLEAAAGGGIGGSITDNQIAVGAATANEIEGSALLTYDGTYLKMDDVAPFGMMFTNTSSGTNAKKFSIGNLLGI
ncbi:MAG: hypothetical protein ACO23H_21015, partial [Alphaproteobacteria bacterium]